MSDHLKSGVTTIGNTEIKVLLTGDPTLSHCAITDSTYGPATGVGLHKHLSFAISASSSTRICAAVGFGLPYEHSLRMVPDRGFEGHALRDLLVEAIPICTIAR
jgi:hypothetical protein